MKDGKLEELDYKILMSLTRDGRKGYKNLGDELEKIVSANCTEEGNCEGKDIYEAARTIMPLEAGTLKKIDELFYDKNKNSIEKISDITEYLMGIAKEIYGKKEQEIGTEIMRTVERAVMLETYDTMWMNHLDEVDYLREGIGLRGYGQRDPLVEYKREAFAMFTHLIENIKSTIARTIFKINLVAAPAQAVSAPERNLTYRGAEEIQQFAAAKQVQNAESNKTEEKRQEPIINKNKVGRNDPCPCGSGKKYKKCHGR